MRQIRADLAVDLARRESLTIEQHLEADEIAAGKQRNRSGAPADDRLFRSGDQVGVPRKARGDREG